MPEPNSTVDPFESAGVRLPTEGVGYASASGLAAFYTVPASPVIPSPIPNELGTALAVLVPFAGVGEILEIESCLPMTQDVAGGPPVLETLIAAPFINDSRAVPGPRAWVATGGIMLATLPAVIPTPAQVQHMQSRVAFQVLATMQFPLLVTIGYVADGAFNTGGIIGVPSIKVHRYRRERIVQLPTQDLLVLIP